MRNKVNYWPESSQKSLLRAAFLTGEDSIEAWQAWKSQVNIDDHPDMGSFRLLSQLYRNLKEQGISDPLMMKFKGVSRQTWYKNQQFFGSIVQPLQALHKVGIDTMLLYGPALAWRYCSDYRLNSTTLVLPVTNVLNYLQDNLDNPTPQKFCPGSTECLLPN